MKLRYGSVCSGVEAAALAWKPLGWECKFVSEVEPFPCAVLHHRLDATRPLHPLKGGVECDDKTAEAWERANNLLPEKGGLVNEGDFTQIEKGKYNGAIDVLVGGTPCQSYSVAGLRKGLADPRGNLALEFVKLAYESGCRWVVWENVPGVLSADKGNAFSTILSAFSGQVVPVPAKGWRTAGIVGGGGGTDTALHGECLTLSMCEHTAFLSPYPSADGVCSLSDILETGDVPQRYYLSRKKCLGILWRALKRGKKLPEMLAIALRKQAEHFKYQQEQEELQMFPAPLT